MSNLSGAAGEELRLYLDVPAGHENLRFSISGGTGDADLNLKFGSQPHSAGDYESRPWLTGNNETCDSTWFDTSRNGRYHVLIRGYVNEGGFSGTSLVGSFDN